MLPTPGPQKAAAAPPSFLEPGCPGRCHHPLFLGLRRLFSAWILHVCSPRTVFLTRGLVWPQSTAH